MSCARCGCGIYKTEEFISLNKVWHKYCFTCYQCNKRLDKDTAKIFQGELFCECCYSTVIEKLFEVISTPSFKRPCEVVSTPSCSVSKTFLQQVKNCECSEQLGKCKKKQFFFPAENSNRIQRTAQSCSCILKESNKKNEYCFIFPIPREVANYYNRSHMKSKSFKNSLPCGSPQQCEECSSRKPSFESGCPVHHKNKCCCGSCQPQCRKMTKKCCCKPQPPPYKPIFTKGCACCSPQESSSCDPCLSPESCSSPFPSLPNIQICQQCQNKEQSKPRRPTTACCPPENCCRPKRHCTPLPRCPQNDCVPIKWCPPQTCCPPKDQSCCQQNTKCCCKNNVRCCCRSLSKYCVCGNLNPCNCKMSQIRSQCIACCNRCRQKVYAAEKIVVSSGAYHTSCFTCYCCNKCLDIKNVYEGCGEIYCKHCYNSFYGVQYYGFGRPNC